MTGDRFYIAVARDVLGLTLSEDLVGVAIEALEDGRDSPSLRVLAGLSGSDVTQARALFDRVLEELGIVRPSMRDAALLLARETAREIVSGTVEPYEGAKRIWELARSAPDESLSELDPFIYAASEWEDRPEDRGHFERGILAEARRLAGG